MTTVVTVLALIVGSVGFISGVLALRTLSKLRRSVALLSRGASGRDTIVDVAERHLATSQAVRKTILDLQRDLIAAQADLEFQVSAERDEIAKAVKGMSVSMHTALRRSALVRYDAFDDLGGRLSFSLALMDDNGDGISLTSIASTSDTRLYAKSLAKGIGEHPLSPEEKQAVKAALSRKVAR
jgi:hypothetical protein